MNALASFLVAIHLLSSVSGLLSKSSSLHPVYMSIIRESMWRVQSGKELVLGGIKPPKAKEWDEEKTYMQRPVGEQFRPPPPKGPQTKQGAAR